MVFDAVGVEPCSDVVHHASKFWFLERLSVYVGIGLYALYFLLCHHHLGDKLFSSNSYPVVIINWVQYLGPPGPFSFPDSRDLLEVLGGLSSAEREDPLGSGRIP